VGLAPSLLVLPPAAASHGMAAVQIAVAIIIAAALLPFASCSPGWTPAAVPFAVSRNP
jgi:hypothetical protein